MTPQPNRAITSLTPYEPGLALEQVAATYGIPEHKVIKLASNENPLGPSPKALAVLQQYTTAHRYPDQYDFLHTLAGFHHITPDMLILGNGSNDVLDLIARAYLEPEDEAISSEYSFAIYQLVTHSAGARNSIVPAFHYGHDLAAMQQAITPATKLVWIANPNNPTGTFLPYSALRAFLAAIPANILVVLDEAYYEYLPDDQKEDTIKWVKEFPNLVITRTFSKIYGLAGLRLGYGIASPQTADYINRVRQPFNANVVALASAKAALADTDFIARSFAANTATRQELIDSLDQQRIERLPAYGNFVTFTLPSAAKVHQALLSRGIIVRPLTSYGMTDWLRVTVGTTTENKLFISNLKEVIDTSIPNTP